MADGYVLIEVNTNGELRLRDEIVHWFDFRLETNDFEASEGLNQIKEQLPKGLKDVLLMVLFKYRVESSYDSWSGATEYEDFYDVDSHSVVKTNYKEFYRKLVTESTKYSREPFGFLDDEELESDKQEISEWEEFYDEEFKPSTV